MKIIQAILEWVMAYLLVVHALITGNMVQNDDSDLPKHLRNPN
jgi:hypothetical protein